MADEITAISGSDANLGVGMKTKTAKVVCFFDKAGTEVGRADGHRMDVRIIMFMILRGYGMKRNVSTTLMPKKIRNRYWQWKSGKPV